MKRCLASQYTFWHLTKHKPVEFLTDYVRHYYTEIVWHLSILPFDKNINPFIFKFTNLCYCKHQLTSAYSNYLPGDLKRCFGNIFGSRFLKKWKSVCKIVHYFRFYRSQFCELWQLECVNSVKVCFSLTKNQSIAASSLLVSQLREFLFRCLTSTHNWLQSLT